MDLDQQFTEVPYQQLRAVERVVQHESLISTICEIALAGIVGGGIQFSRDQKALTSHEDRFYAHVWLDFTRKMVMNLWIYGFAAVLFEPHERFGAVPRLLALDQVRVKIRRSLLGATDYVYLRQMAPGGGYGPTYINETPVLGVLTLELDPPDLHGHLRSKAACVP
jgi:hypothetical protein